MSVEPPSSGRPTGPPSGPLSGPSSGSPSGPSQPPSGGPPSPPPGGGGGSTGPGRPRRPWWRSAPRLAVLAVVVVAAVVLAVVFSRTGGDSGTVGEPGTQGEVFLQAAGTSGPDPFTESTAKDSSIPSERPSPDTESGPPNELRGADGGEPGLYGGTRNVSSCDVEKQIDALGADPDKNRAFASVAGVDPADVPDHLRGLTPVQLRVDTRVTNHGFRDGKATPYQSVLQAGTAVLVDDRGVPRVRCACGNPLTEPVAQPVTPRTTGDPWPGYRASNVVVVEPAPRPVEVFVLYDPERNEWISRPAGDTGGKDRETERPTDPASPSPGEPTPAPPTEPTSPAPDTGERTTEGPTTQDPGTPEAPGTTGDPGTTDPPPADPGTVPQSLPSAQVPPSPAAPPAV
ncbi:DUF6777 domain-containing protein [Streptomyces sp. HMX87]|uniref:DUF6777 domain-containing protein n=1 Tax=Streptomyces sp. HMX87 TaxID=3390849 RepID=UPI003A83D210